MKWLIPWAIIATNLSYGQQVNGPMVGHIDHMEAHIWTQCPGGCAMQIRYRVDGSDTWLLTELIDTQQETANCHTFVLRGLRAGTTYDYYLLVNDVPLLREQNLEFRTEPIHRYRDSVPALKMVLGSCTYINDIPYDRPGEPYGIVNGIFERMAEENPDITLWLGDNIYLREPDWGSLSGYHYRYTHTRSAPEIQRLLRTGSHYAIWDDHDFGPNNACGNWVNSSIAKQAFIDFWANPTYGVPGATRGIGTQFQYLDVDFFLLDDRTYRETPNKKGTKDMLGGKQMDQLLEALSQSEAPFKLVLVGGQILNSAAVFENYAQYSEERTSLLQQINDLGITGVVFLTGDRHHSALNKVTTSNGIDIYDLTVSPLTSKAYVPEETNTNLVPGTVVSTQNYAVIEITGISGARVMTITVKSADAKEFWTHAISQTSK
jgi:alkaline phosphatase D